MYVDLRAQLVPIVASLVALGLGILIGGILSSDGGLVLEQQRLLADLEQQFAQLRSERNAYRQEIENLQEQLAARDHLLSSIAPAYLAPRAARLRVAVLNLGGGTFARELLQRLEATGVKARVLSIDDLSRLVAAASPEGEPVQTAAQQDELEAGSVPTYRLPRRRKGVSGQELVPLLYELLQGLPAGGVSQIDPQVADLMRAVGLKVTGLATARPQTVLFLVGPTVRPLFGTLITPLVALLRSERLHLVAAEPSQTEDSLMDLWRVLGVTTVDNAETPVGLVSLILALEGRQGHFGSGSAAERLYPRLDAPAKVAVPGQ